mgnify:FL=1
MFRYIKPLDIQPQSAGRGTKDQVVFNWWASNSVWIADNQKDLSCELTAWLKVVGKADETVVDAEKAVWMALEPKNNALRLGTESTISES